jgi:hypothetical protein
MKMSVFRDVAPCSLVEVRQRSRVRTDCVVRAMTTRRNIPKYVFVKPVP